MNRTEFIVATAIILFAAFMLGWFASWLIHRLSCVTCAEMGELESMAQQLHEAEEPATAPFPNWKSARPIWSLLSTAEAEFAARGELRETHAEIEELRDYIKRKSSKKTRPTKGARLTKRPRAMPGLVRFRRAGFRRRPR